MALTVQFAASLLIEQGYEIETVYVKTWEHENDVLGDCPGAIDLKDAEVVSDQLGIPFRVLNLMDFYPPCGSPNGQDMLGITPNPDVLCNREMKFGALKEYAEKEGFQLLQQVTIVAEFKYQVMMSSFGKEGIRLKINLIF